MSWQRQGPYGYEVGPDCQYTGWARCVGGRMAIGRSSTT